MVKNIIITNRAISPLEKKAYKNLRDYDGGEYQVKHAKEISNIIFKNDIEYKYKPKALDITQEQIEEYVLHAQIINLKHSDFKQPGIFAKEILTNHLLLKKYILILNLNLLSVSLYLTIISMLLKMVIKELL